MKKSRMNTWRLENVLTSIAFSAMPGMSGAAGRVANVLTGATGAAMGLGQPLIAITGILAGVAIGFERAKKQAEEFQKALEANRDRRQGQLEAIGGRYQRIAPDRDPQQQQAALRNEALLRVQAQTQAVAALTKEYKEAQAALENTSRGFDRFGEGAATASDAYLAAEARVKELEGRLRDGSQVVGQRMQSSVDPDTGVRSVQFKTGNRELDPQRMDFYWYRQDEIRDLEFPEEQFVLERVENGNFYGFLLDVKTPSLTLPAGGEPAHRFRAALAEVRIRAARERKPLERQLSDLNGKLQRLGAAILKLEYRRKRIRSGSAAGTQDSSDLAAQIQEAARRGVIDPADARPGGPSPAHHVRGAWRTDLYCPAPRVSWCAIFSQQIASLSTWARGA